MSHQAVSWALQQPIEHSPAKFILVTLAHFVSHDQEAPWRAYASVTTLVQATGQNRKTVLTNIQRLVDVGCLIDTGERIGGTKSVVVYQLSEPRSGMEIGTASNRVSNPKIGTAKQSQNVAEAVPKLDISGTEIGTASNLEAVPILDGSGPNFGHKQSQNVAEAVPKSSTEEEKQKERQEEKQKKNIAPAQSAGAHASPPLNAADLTAEGVVDEVAAEFLALRKRKRAPLTLLALEGIKREAASVGWTLDQALRRCVERGWQGFDASWVQPRSAAPARMTRQEVADAEQQRFLRMVGGDSDDGRTFEMGGQNAIF